MSTEIATIDRAQRANTGAARWVALVVLCVGMLMIVLDQTIVNGALPSIQNDLGFTQSNLAWVVMPTCRVRGVASARRAPEPLLPMVRIPTPPLDVIRTATRQETAS